MFKLSLNSDFSYTMRHNPFGFLDMTSVDYDEIVFYRKDILLLIKAIKTVTWEFIQFNEL